MTIRFDVGGGSAGVDLPDRHATLRTGASGFLLRDEGPAQLLRATRVVAAGEALLAPSLTSRLIAEFAIRPDPAGTPAEFDSLTRRSLESSESSPPVSATRRSPRAS